MKNLFKKKINLPLIFNFDKTLEEIDDRLEKINSEISETLLELKRITKLINYVHEKKKQLTNLQASLEALLQFNFTHHDKKNTKHQRSKSFTKRAEKPIYTTLITERNEEPKYLKERRLSFEIKKSNNICNKGIECSKHKKYYKFDSENATIKQIELFANVIE